MSARSAESFGLKFILKWSCMPMVRVIYEGGCQDNDDDNDDNDNDNDDDGGNLRGHRGCLAGWLSAHPPPRGKPVASEWSGLIFIRMIRMIGTMIFLLYRFQPMRRVPVLRCASISCFQVISKWVSESFFFGFSVSTVSTALTVNTVNTFNAVTVVKTFYTRSVHSIQS